jgi:hypothetical protein
MELLALTSKVLYDTDILDKQKEITKIKKELKDNKPPKIIYKNYEEWESLKQEAIKICEEANLGYLCDDIIESEGDYSGSGRDYGEGCNIIRNTIVNAFKKLSKGFMNNWMWDYASTIEDIIVHSIQSLDNIGILDTLSSDQEDWYIKNILVDIFSDQYNKGEDGIAQICYFKCSECDNLDCWVDNDNKCGDCSPEMN